jgi:PmbA protein
MYDSMMATRLLAQWLNSANGMAVVTNASFLAGKIGLSVCADHLTIVEDPSIPGGLATRPFDSDGIAPRRRALVDCGTLTGYLLSAYTARRLKLAPTGNADGSGNIELISAMTRADDDFAAMLRRLDTGFLVTGLTAGGFNGLTGAYSQGAEGFWVEGGEIQYPVDNVTIAADVTSMLGGSVAVGADRYTSGALTSGSILVGEMRLAGR